jgi:hypothetical protein
MHTEEVLPQEVDELKGHYKQILTLLGEDVERK